MATIELPAALDTELELPDWAVEPRPSIMRRVVGRFLAIREIGILTIVALIGYSFTGWWLFYVQHFFINDEINKTADALYVTVGRDPHLGAIGFYWPPLPQLINCIFVPITEPFGATIMGGTLQTAFCMALTIPVLAQIGKSLGVGRWTTFAICLVFAITPVTIYNSANGMSEAAFFLTGSLTMLGFFRYIRSHSTGDMILFSVSMSAFVLARLEGPAVALVLIVVAAFDWQSLRSWQALRQSTWTAVLLGLPPLATFTFWCLVQWILLKDPLFFLHQPGTPLGAGASWLPNYSHNKLVLIPWALHWTLVLGVVLGVALLGVVLAPLSNRTRGSIGLVGAISTILAIEVYTVGFGGGFGDPRYFSMAVPWAACAALWLASWTRETPLNPSPSRDPLAAWWNLALITILVVNAGTGNWTMSSGRTTGIEHECTFFQGDVARFLPFLGRGANPKSQAYCTPEGNGIKSWEDAAHWLDKRLQPSDRVLTDNIAIFYPDLFTRHPNQYIVRNDRDWQKTVATPAGKFDFIITEAKKRNGRPLQENSSTGASQDYGASMIDERPAAWKLIFQVGGAGSAGIGQGTWVQIYKLSGKVVPLGINGPTGQ